MSTAYDALIDEWNRAESALKKAELASGEAATPAINELRYAGRRIVESLSVGNEATRQKLVDEAILLCRRATDDAIDAQVFHWVALFNRISQSDQLKSLPPPAQVDIQAVLIQIGEEIAASRSDRETRHERYRKIQNLADRLAYIAADIDLVALNRATTRRLTQRKYAELFFAALAAVAGAAASGYGIAAFETIFKWFR